MSFTHPSFLFALAAIAIPIIIHLFNFRKFKTVNFSNVRFLKEVKQETQSKSKVKHLLVLAARILAITFLVFAFAQPFIPSKNDNIMAGNSIVSIFVDNSFSMEATNENGSLLDDAKKKAMEILSAYKATDQFQLLTNNFKGKHQRRVNKEEFEELLSEVKISPTSKSISQIGARQIDLLKQANDLTNLSAVKNKSAFIISDFQKNNFNISKFQNDTSVKFNLVQLEAAEQSNVYIDTCWFETPFRQTNQREKLHVRIKNLSNNALKNNSLKLFINNKLKTPSNFSVEPNSETEVAISFTANKPDNNGANSENDIMHCRLEIKDHPVTFDDSFFFSFKITKNIQALCINPSKHDTTPLENQHLNSLFTNDSLFIYEKASANKLDYSNLANKDLIILNELKTISSGLSLELKRFISNGGSLLIFPNKEINLNAYKNFLLSVNANYYTRTDTLKTKVDQLNFDHEIYSDVFDIESSKANNIDLPKVNFHYSFSKNTKNTEEQLLTLQNRDAFLSKYTIGKGKLYVSSTPLQEVCSNFSKHSIFVPTLYKIGIYSQKPQPLFYTIGDNKNIETKSDLKGENIYHIKSLNTNFDIIPEHIIMSSKTEINTRNQVNMAGNYNLLTGNNISTGLAFNFSRKESDLSRLSKTVLKKHIDNYNANNISIIKDTKNNLSNIISSTTKGESLWKHCLILALLFLGTETLLLRFLKG